MDSSSAVQLVTILILVLLSGFFSSAETALSSVNRVRIRAMIEDGNKRAKLVDKILDNYSKMISTILIGNNIVNISASALATTWTTNVFGNQYIGIMTGVLTLIVLLFGEITPKTMASIHAEKMALLYAPIVYFLMRLLTPAIFIVNLLAQGILLFFLFYFRASLKVCATFSMRPSTKGLSSPAPSTKLRN